MSSENNDNNQNNNDLNKNDLDEKNIGETIIENSENSDNSDNYKNNTVNKKSNEKDECIENIFNSKDELNLGDDAKHLAETDKLLSMFFGQIIKETMLESFKSNNNKQNNLMTFPISFDMKIENFDSNGNIKSEK